MPALIDNPEFSEVAGKIDLSTAPFGMQGGWGWAIPKSAPNPDAAWEFIKWVESPEIAKKRAMLGGAATRLDVLEDPEVLAAFPFQEKIREWLKTGKPFPIVCRSQEIIDTLSLNVSEALAGTKDPQAAMDEAAEVLNDIVAEDPLVNK
jgi:ABC-type glycerol-3-phosphate transport system substrate-binding protein